MQHRLKMMITIRSEERVFACRAMPDGGTRKTFSARAMDGGMARGSGARNGAFLTEGCRSASANAAILNNIFAFLKKLSF